MAAGREVAAEAEAGGEGRGPQGEVHVSNRKPLGGTSKTGGPLTTTCEGDTLPVGLCTQLLARGRARLLPPLDRPCPIEPTQQMKPTAHPGAGAGAAPGWRTKTVRPPSVWQQYSTSRPPSSPQPWHTPRPKTPSREEKGARPWGRGLAGRGGCRRGSTGSKLTVRLAQCCRDCKGIAERESGLHSDWALKRFQRMGIDDATAVRWHHSASPPRANGASSTP